MWFKYLYYFLEEIYNFFTNFLKSFLSYFIDFKPERYDSFDIQEHESSLIETLNQILFSISNTKEKFATSIENSEFSNPCMNIDNLAFSGGGAKGITYPGAYRALKDSELLQKVKHISGASAGSIISAFIATGMPLKRFREEISSINFKSLLGNTIDFFSNLPGTIRFFTKNGTPLYNFIKMNINKSIKDLVSTSDFDATIKESKNISNDDDYIYLLKLKDKLQKNNLESLKITFKDLAILNKFFPEKFKLLYVNAVKHPNGEVQLFSHIDTPEVEIALACRASSAIPGLIQPAEIEINGEINRYIDGGVYDNIPVDCFDCESHNNKTLLFSFGEGLSNDRNWTHKAIHGGFDDEENNAAIFKPSVFIKFIRKIPSWFGIINLPYCLDKRKDAGLQNIRKKFRLRTVELKVAGVNTADFDYAEKVVKTMDALGYLDTMNYIINHNTYDLFAKGAYPEFYNDLFNIFNSSFEFILENPYLKISAEDKQFIEDLNKTVKPYSHREKIYKIKEFTEHNLESSIAYVLAKSLELMSNMTTPEAFCEDITLFTQKFAYPKEKQPASITCTC